MLYEVEYLAIIVAIAAGLYVAVRFMQAIW